MNKENAFESLLSANNLAEIKKIELRSKRSVNSNMAGQYRSAFRGSGLIFSDIREYMPGDDVKHIHWKVTARSNKVYIKSYEEERELNVLIALDISNSTTAGCMKSKYQKGLEFCAIISMLTKLNQDSLGLCLFSNKMEEFIAVKKSRSQLKRVIMELLKPRDHSKSTDITNSLSELSKNLKKTSVVFVISDFYSPSYNDALSMLSAKHDVIAVMLEDELDYNLPNAGLVEFKDAESGNLITLDCNNQKVRMKLKFAYEKRINDWKVSCRKANCDFMQIKDNPLRSLNQLMLKRNHRII